MKITKKTVENGMTFRIINNMECVPFVWDPDNFLNMDANQFMTLSSGLVMFSREPKKYNCGHGMTGDMITFVYKGTSYAAFWSEFKKNTTFIDGSIPLDVDGDVIEIGDRVCYVRTTGLAAPTLCMEDVTEIIPITDNTYTNSERRAPNRVKIKMGKKFTFDTRTRIKIVSR